MRLRKEVDSRLRGNDATIGNLVNENIGVRGRSVRDGLTL
jgi:hypothetical protein